MVIPVIVRNCLTNLEIDSFNISYRFDVKWDNIRHLPPSALLSKKASHYFLNRKEARGNLFIYWFSLCLKFKSISIVSRGTGGFRAQQVTFRESTVYLLEEVFCGELFEELSVLLFLYFFLSFGLNKIWILSRDLKG